MKGVDTVIFDVSGVLLNDLLCVWKADSEAYELSGLGSIGNIGQFKETFKLPIYEYHKAMNVPDEIIPILEAEFTRAYSKYDHLISIFPEVPLVLESLKKDKIKLAIASNIHSSFLREHLERFEISEYFQVVTGQDDCVEQKPSPRPLLDTLRGLGSRPERSAYIGDMEEDMIAGKRAGFKTIGICREESYHPCWKILRQQPDYIISTLEGLPIIIQELNKSTES